MCTKSITNAFTKVRFPFELDRQITLAGEYEVAGTPALYERDRDREKVRIPGPIKEDIAVYVRIQRCVASVN